MEFQDNVFRQELIRNSKPWLYVLGSHTVIFKLFEETMHVHTLIRRFILEV